MANNKDIFEGLVVFTQVVQSGGFSSAAQAMGHSTSYISKEISKLEQRLGIRLLNRTTRTVSLTPEGESYFQQCVQLVEDASNAIEILHQHKAEPTGNFKISCPISFGLNHLQPIISEYLAKYPNVNITLDLNDRKVDLIDEGFDLVIRATAQLNESNLICRKIYSSPAYTIASSNYLSKHGVPQTPEQLKTHRCICYSNLAIPNRWHFKGQSEEDIYIDVKRTILCNSAAMQLAMAIDGHGIARLPGFAINQALKNKQIEILLADYPQKTIDVYAIYPSRKHLSAKVRQFIDLVTESFAH